LPEREETKGKIMDTLGLITNVPYSTGLDYQLRIHQGVANASGDESKCADIIARGFDWAEVKPLLDKGEEGYRILARKYKSIINMFEMSCVKIVAIASNAFHVICDYGLTDGTSVQFLHIVDPLVKEIKKFEETKCVGVLGGRTVMEHPFYLSRLNAAGYETIVPDKKEDRDFVHSLVTSKEIKPANPNIPIHVRWRIYEIMSNLKKDGADGIIFACPNLQKVINLVDKGENGKFALRPGDSQVHLGSNSNNMRVFDASAIHIDEIVRRMLSGYVKQ